jgi:hypothetical protein
MLLSKPRVCSACGDAVLQLRCQLPGVTLCVHSLAINQIALHPSAIVFYAQQMVWISRILLCELLHSCLWYGHGNDVITMKRVNDYRYLLK